jgi:hyaluronoglucosaminidase
VVNPATTALRPPLGIIEGFFGAMWSWEERETVLRTVARAGYSFYLYAPKGDVALRRQWDAPFESHWMERVHTFSALCRSLGVSFGIGFSPYGLQGTLDSANTTKLQKKLAEMRQLNLDMLALLFDDMDATVDNLVANQARIVDVVTSSGVAQRYSVCPSYYSDDVILDVVFGQRPNHYLRDFCRAIDQRINVFWTGEEVCARQIGVAHLTRVAEEMGRAPMLWDNYPVNDGARMSSHLHLRAFTGRNSEIAECMTGHAINPALQPVLSTIPATTLAMSYDQGRSYAYSAAFVTAARRIVGEAMASCLQEDLIALQDLGLHRFDDARRSSLRTRYAAFDQPAAKEILRWLGGEYSMSAELVKTQ